MTEYAITTAYDWHGGQWSALYQFASTGRISDETHRARLIAEIDERLERCHTDGEQEAGDIESLESLRRLVAQSAIGPLRQSVKRYSGSVEIGLIYHDRTDDNRARFSGYVESDGQRWEFDDLCSGVGMDGTRPEDFDRMAADALGFATYYTSDNRGDDYPESPNTYPSAALADAFSDSCDRGRIQREKHGTTVYDEN